MAYRMVPLSILLIILSAEARAAPPSACVVNSPALSADIGQRGLVDKD